MLAGVSIDYYTQLERGNARDVSEDVLEGIARALQLDVGQTMIVYTAEPGSPSGEALNLLASSTRTPNQVTAVRGDHGG